MAEEMFDLSTVDGFEIERMLADKLLAILSRKRFRRTKDLYDFYALTETFDMDMDKLDRYIKLRGNAEWENIPFSDAVLIEYEKAWNKLILVGYKTDETLHKPEFFLAIRRFNAFAFPLKDGRYESRWSAQRGGFV